jgi:hypothetical protein
VGTSVFTLLPSAASGCNDENATYEARRLSTACACACAAAAVAKSFDGAAGPAAVLCEVAAETAFEVLLPPLGVADRPPDEAVAATVAPAEVALFIFVEAVAAAGVGVVAFFAVGLAAAAAGGFAAEARISG